MVSKEADHARGIWRVQYPVRVGDAWHIAVSDLIFQEGQPVVVIEWGEPPGRLDPEVKQKLDPLLLSPLVDTAADFLYSGPVEDPRKVN